ncbi:MAG: CPBP family intramembrane glutamic endopeptidase, partial [bacterium]
MTSLDRPSSSRNGLVALVAAGALVAAATAAWLFPRAFPIVALQQSLTRDGALVRADSFFRAHDLAPVAARTAVRFQANDSLRTFVELAGGGPDSLSALAHGHDVTPFRWAVRAFVPHDPHEARVDFAPDGRITGFVRTFAEADRRPAITADSAQALAGVALGAWIGERLDRWRLVSSSYETRKTSGRIDRTFTYERTDRRVAGAPVRAEVVVAGNAPTMVRQFVEIPQSFQRRYGEMRSSNDLIALVASLGALVIGIAGVVFAARASRARDLRWREAMFVGAVIGVLTVGAGLNEMGSSWYEYDTATSPIAFQMRNALGALLGGGLTGLLAGLTLVAAEAASRRAFPRHLDWWKLWRYRGTRDVAARVFGGYAVSTVAFAYVAVFYLVTRRFLGWWVPSEMLDDPNLIATPMPWLSGIAMSLNAGVWEETLFRALPLSLLSLWVGGRPTRRWWMAAGVVATALTFGFAHANYASWPPYSRGVEIFLDACFWGVLVLQFGVLVTVVAHFAYDLVLFGLFATSGSAVEYRVSAAIIALALLAPALAVGWRWWRQRGLVAAPEDARFEAWRAADRVAVPADTRVPRLAGILTRRARRFALASAAVAAIAAVAGPAAPTLGHSFTATRARVMTTADSMVRARGGTPSAWRHLAATATDTLAPWPRFVRQHALTSRVQAIAASYLPAAWWTVRYVHTSGTTAERAEEWRVRVWPDGRPLDARHIIADSASRPAVTPDSARRIALAALARDGVRTAGLQEAQLTEKALPARHDVLVNYTDTTVRLPAGAVARAWVQVAGDEPLVARRGIELPENFVRADRERQTTRGLVAGLSMLLLLGVVITGAVLVVRRRPVLVHDGVIDRRGAVMFVGTLVVLSVLADFNALPSSLFAYDTAQPWGSFVGTRVIAFIAAIPLAFVLYGLWLAFDALRRRVGVPMLGARGTESPSSDAIVAGLGLGSVVYALARAGDLVPSQTMPRPPSTLLDAAIPAFDRLPALPQTTIAAVAMLGIPVLVVAGLTTRWLTRALLAAVMVGLLVASMLAMAPANSVSPVRML